MIRILSRVLLWLVLVAVFALVVDSVRWQLRLSHGEGLQDVEVHRVSIATLKNGKEEYYPSETVTQRCSRTVLPMPTSAGVFTPCWWLQKHTEQDSRP